MDAVDLSELADDLSESGYRLAARLIREGRRECWPEIAADIAPTSWLFAAQVQAWGMGRDAAIVASNTAWRRAGCHRCAMAALGSGDAGTWCDRCREDIAQEGGA